MAICLQTTFGHFPNSVKETRQVESNWLISSIRVLNGRNMGQIMIGADGQVVDYRIILYRRNTVTKRAKAKREKPAMKNSLIRGKTPI
jgi:hypothetical protein